MKLLTKLPGRLRQLFGFLRIMTLVLAVFWAVALVLNFWIRDRTGHGAGLLSTVGEIALPAAPGAVGLGSNTAAPGALHLLALHGSLQVDLASNDRALVSAVLWSLVPSMLAMIAYAYLLFTALRDVCANLARGDVFNEENLRLVRRIGLLLIAYGVLGALLESWASVVLSGYFGPHVTLTGLGSALSFPGGGASLDFFRFAPGLMSSFGRLLVGVLVLVVAEAFRQGLLLKAENDLTV